MNELRMHILSFGATTALLLCLSVSHVVAHDGCAQRAQASCCRAKATKQVEQQEATLERAAVPTIADREQGTTKEEGCCRKSSSAAKTAAKSDSCHDDEATQAQDGCCSSTRATTEEGPSSSEETPQ